MNVESIFQDFQGAVLEKTQSNHIRQKKKTPLQKYLLSNYYPVLFSIKLRMREIYI